MTAKGQIVAKAQITIAKLMTQWASLDAHCLFRCGVYEQISLSRILAYSTYFLSNGGITCKSGKQVLVNKGKWDKSLGFKFNHTFNKTCIAVCYDLLDKNGSIWISGTYHNIYSIYQNTQYMRTRILSYSLLVYSFESPLEILEASPSPFTEIWSSSPVMFSSAIK